MRAWEQRESARTGKPVPQVLPELLEQSGGKVEVAARMLGFKTHSAVCKMYARHGVRWESYRDFEYQGEVGTFWAHCLRLGINPKTANAYRRRGNRSDVAVLDYYVNRMAA